VQTLMLSGHDPQANLDEERRLFEAARREPAPLCLFYVNNPCIIMGRNNVLEQWVNQQAADADGVPVLRRFSGGGAVYHDLDVLNYSFIVPRVDLERQAGRIESTSLANKYIALFIGLLVRALTRLAPGFTAARLSDVNLNGRKVSGNAQRIAKEVVLHHGTLLTRCPLAEIERYLPLPPDRPGISHADFVTGLAEEGLATSVDRLRKTIYAEFQQVFSQGG
jgi:lipoate-protein ligase A